MSKTTNKNSPKVRDRSVRIVLSNEGQHEISEGRRREAETELREVDRGMTHGL